MSLIQGFPYPIENTAKGLFYSNDDIAQIKASMLTILLTTPGDRVMEPSFGTPLHNLMKFNRGLIEEEAKQMIANSLKRWEKRVQVEDIQAAVIDTDNGLDLHIQVFFIDPTHLQETQLLSIQTPIGR